MNKLLAFPFALALFTGLAQSQSTDSKNLDHANMDHAAHMKTMADSQRQAQVSERGGDVMPFSLSATTHFFARSVQGGVQQVVAKKPDDTSQVKLVRLHLQSIREQFLRNDYAGPSHIHGKDMPGLAELTAATPGQIDITYKEIAGGASLTYATANGALVAALHQWFEAQLSDHGGDAKSGHAH
jgi:hypothetical protein